MISPSFFIELKWKDFKAQYLLPLLQCPILMRLHKISFPSNAINKICILILKLILKEIF